MEESDFPKQEAQANAEGDATAAAIKQPINRIQSRFIFRGS